MGEESKPRSSERTASVPFENSIMNYLINTVHLDHIQHSSSISFQTHPIPLPIQFLSPCFSPCLCNLSPSFLFLSHLLCLPIDPLGVSQTLLSMGPTLRVRSTTQGHTYKDILFFLPDATSCQELLRQW